MDPAVYICCRTCRTQPQPWTQQGCLGTHQSLPHSMEKVEQMEGYKGQRGHSEQRIYKDIVNKITDIITQCFAFCWHMWAIINYRQLNKRGMCENASRSLGLSDSVWLCVNTQLGQRLGRKEQTGRSLFMWVGDLPVGASYINQQSDLQ